MYPFIAAMSFLSVMFVGYETDGSGKLVAITAFIQGMVFSCAIFLTLLGWDDE